MQAEQYAPGHYPELSNDAYHASPGFSKSHLDDIAPPKSPLHYWQKRINPNREAMEPTPALVLGDAIHKAILEPDLVARRFAVWDGPSRSTTKGKEMWAEFSAASLGKVILNADQHEAMIRVRDAVHRHHLAKGLVTGGASEQSYFAKDPDTGALIKCRIDYDRLARHGQMVDVKSTEDASEDGFGRSAAKFRYDVQGGWYPHVVQQLGYEVRNFIFIAVEKEPPNAIGVYYLEPADAMAGMEKARRDLDRILEHRAKGYWPDFAEKPKPLKLPAWHKAKVSELAA